MKKFKSFLVGFLVLVLSLTLVPEIPSYASSAVDLIGDSSLADVGGVRYGVSYKQNGYLCYLLTSSGSKVSGTNAYAFKCPGFNTITAGGTPVFYASSRKGDYLATSWSGKAPWGCSPFNADQTTNSEQIRGWLKARHSSGLTNSQVFIKDNWGSTAMQKYETGDYILVIETIMHFRYSFDYTFPNLSRAEWGQIAHDMYWYAGSQAVSVYADSFYEEGRTGNKYRIPYGEPIIGTVSDCLRYESAMKDSFLLHYPYVSVCNYNLFRDYLNKVAPFAERIGVGGAGQRAGFLPWTGSTSDLMPTNKVYSHGVAMLVISALEDDVVGDDIPLDSSSSSTTYDGTIYTLTSAGGSKSSGGDIGSFAGGSASDTTELGWGSGDSCAIGSLYAENCATGDEPYALADSMKRGMSYEGDVPAVVFSGTSYDVAIDNSMGIIPSMLTVDPSSFPYVSISSSPDSSYTAYLNTIKGSLSPSVTINHNGSVAGTYSGSSLESSSVIGGSSDIHTANIKQVCQLTKANSRRSGSSITWSDSGEYNMLCTKFAQVFYNNQGANASAGKSILENTDLMRAYRASTQAYTSNLKANGTLEAHWNNAFESYCVSKGRSAGNSARSQWESENPSPEEPVEPVRSDYSNDRTFNAAHTTWEREHGIYAQDLADWVSGSNNAYQSAYNSTYNHHRNTEANTFSCSYETPQSWTFKFYYCSPIMQRLYGVHDKIPVDDGPARGNKLWDEAWKVGFKLNVQNNATLSNDIQRRLLTYMPLAGNTCTTVGGVSSVGYYVYNKPISKTDFLLPDATSMDMR